MYIFMIYTFASLANNAADFLDTIGGSGAHCLFPIINITEDRASHSAKIQHEITMHAHFSLHDILHHSVHAQTVLASDSNQLADALDACGLNCFYSVHYEPSLLTVEYPHTTLRFLPACLAPRVGPGRPRASRPHRTRPPPMPLRHCARFILSPGLLQFSPAEQVHDEVITMVWDLVSLSTIKTMTMGR